MRAAIIESLADFRAIRGEWDALVARSPTADLFSTFDWLEAFWLAFARPDDALAVYTVRDAGRLVAALPLVASRTLPLAHQLGPIGRIRPARRLGATRLASMFNFFSGRSDVLLDPSAKGALAELVGALESSRKDWDVIELAWVPEDSPLYLHLAHAEIPGLSAYAVLAAECPYLDLENVLYEDYAMRRFSAKTRSRDRVQLREAAAHPGFALDVLEAPAQVRRCVDEAMAIESRGWKGDARSAMGDDPVVSAFVHDVCARFADRGELVIVRLEVARVPAAFVIGFVYKGVFSYYKTSFDPRLAELRPGRIVTNRALEHAFALGLDRFDFLGAADSYKLRYTDCTRKHAAVFLHHSGVRSRAARTLKRTLVPAAKKVLGRPEIFPVHVDRRGPT